MYRLTLLVVALLVILACGGGGGGGTGGGGGITVAVSPKTSNVAAGSTVNFSANVSGTSDRRVSWTATSGSITSTGESTARFIAPAGGSSTITGRSVADASKFDTATVNVAAATGVNVNGRVIDDFTTAGLQGVVVEFLNNSKVVVGSASTNATGGFSTKLPKTARFIRLPAATFPAGYYSQFMYKDVRYSTIIVGCDAPISTLVDGDNPLGNIRLSPTHQPPPPPPNGCS